MRKRARFTLIVVTVLVILAASAFAVYLALQHVPDFYAEAISIPPESQAKESDHMLQQVTKLHNDLQLQGRWQHVFQAQTINGWLAVDLPQNHPTLLSHGLHDPRVRISRQGITMACQIDRGSLHGVVSLEVSPFVESPDVVGLRVHEARVGAIPWPLQNVLDRIADAAKKANVDIRWRQEDNDPVALIKITPAKADGKRIVHIDTIRLEEGALVVAGTTEKAPK
jgi:hypothetical protein